MSNAGATHIDPSTAIVDDNQRASGRFGRGRRFPDSRSTVTFGDASSVRSDSRFTVLAVLVLLFLWWVLKLGEDPVLNDRTLPSIGETVSTLGDLATDGYRNTSLWSHMWASVWRVIRGIFWGTLVGVPVGFAMGLSSKVRGFFDAPVELFRPIPPLALIPLFILWFGIGDGTAWKLLVFATIWIMIIAARAGVRTVNLSKVRAAYSLGASKPQLLFRVILPNALPEIFTGLRVSIGVAWGTVVAAELVGTSDGLGAMIFAARTFSRIDVVFAGILIIAFLGVAMDVMMRFLEAKLIPWRGKG